MELTPEQLSSHKRISNMARPIKYDVYTVMIFSICYILCIVKLSYTSNLTADIVLCIVTVFLSVAASAILYIQGWAILLAVAWYEANADQCSDSRVDAIKSASNHHYYKGVILALISLAVAVTWDNVPELFKEFQMAYLLSFVVALYLANTYQGSLIRLGRK